MRTAYGLDPVMARLEGTAKTVISIAILVVNLKKLLAFSLARFRQAVNSAICYLIGRLSTLGQGLPKHQANAC